jgi:AAA domain-containing protein
MGVRNYLIEGVSATGKTSVCKELRRRGYYAVNGDTDLSYQGDPDTGEFTQESGHEHHLWDVDRVKALVAKQDVGLAFFCGGSRNFSKFIDAFDGVYILDVDVATLNRRLDQRPEDEFGGRQAERELILQLHRTKEDIPKNGVVIDAAAPIEHVVDEILRRSGPDRSPYGGSPIAS